MTSAVADTDQMVVVGCADSRSGRAAAAFGAAEALRRHTRLKLVLAYEPDIDPDAMEFEMDPQRCRERARRDAQRLADEVVEQLGGEAPAIDVVVEQGTAAHVLLRAAESAALLVIGARPDGRLDRLLRSSTTTHVLRHAQLPVVIVPAP